MMLKSNGLLPNKRRIRVGAPLDEDSQTWMVGGADRIYIYDNSIDDADARLLFRMTSGQLFKQYTDDIPEWAMPILR